MTDQELVHSIQAFAQRPGEHYCARKTNIEGLVTLCADRPTRMQASVYEPVVCLILQGRKETWLGEHHYNLGAGDSLIVSHHLPVTSRVNEASPEKPYVALVLSVDMTIIGNLYDEISEVELKRSNISALDAGRADREFVEVMGRLFQLNQRLLEARVMEPLLRREIHFRMLLARHGAMLRTLLNHDSAASRVAKAIRILRQDYKSALSIPDLASTAGMSTSSFHAHFKATTATTPLQFQKDLRLIEARRLLTEGSQTVAHVAYEVGYESPTQFSREYSRKFGIPPREEISAGLVNA